MLHLGRLFTGGLCFVRLCEIAEEVGEVGCLCGFSSIKGGCGRGK